MAESNVVRVLRAVEPAVKLPLGTVTFLLADLEGSVRLWDADEVGMTEAVARLDVLVDATVDQHRGVRPVEQGEGDSFVAVFERPADAVACALDLQLAMAREPWPGNLRLRVRMALHTGEAQLRDEGNYVGTSISRCGRLRSLGHGGQVLLSPTTFELVADALPERATLRDLGMQRVRDVPRPLRIYQLCHPELDDRFPALRSLEVLTRNLPQPLTTFIGRTKELEEVIGLLAERRLVTLTGGGGCGKTRLALRAAEEVADRFPDGLWFVDLAAVRDGVDVLRAVGSAVGCRRPEPDMLVEFLRARRALLLLDNCEQVVEPCAELAEVILRGCPAVSILATSREQLRAEGETTWRVPSMSMPTTESGVALDTYDAVRLFIDRATRARPNFEVTNDNAPAVAAICQHLDGIPLALELAAARVRVLTADQIASGLSDRFRLLRGPSRTGLARHQTLAASVDWSHALLSEGEATLLRRLSVFHGGFTLDAAERVAADDDLDALDVLDLLTSLVDKSLVATGDDGPDGRYRMLETIREYAATKLDTAGERDAVQARHAHAFAATARRVRAGIEHGEQLVTIRGADADLDNLRAAIDWAVEHDAEVGLRMAVDLAMFANIRGHWHEARRWLDRLLEACQEVPADLIGSVTFVHAGFGAMVGLGAESRPVMEALAGVVSEGDDHQLTAWVFNQIGKYSAIDDVERGRGQIERSLEAAEAAGREGFGVRLDSLAYGAWLDLTTAHLDEAIEKLDESVRIARAEGDVRGLLISMPPRAAVAIRRGELDLAQRTLDEGLELAADVGDPFSAAIALLMSGAIAAARGDHHAAYELTIEGIRAGKETGSPFLAAADGYLARLRFIEGDPRGALELWSEASQALDPMTSWLFATMTSFTGPGPWLLEAGDLVGAKRAIDRDLSTAVAGGHALSVAQLTLERARLRLRAGEVRDARQDVLDALEVFAGVRAIPDVICALEVLAGADTAVGAHDDAAVLLGAAAAAREATGLVRHVYETALVDAVQSAAAAPADGDRTPSAVPPASLDEAIALALRRRGPRGRPSSGWDSLTPTELQVVELVAAGATNQRVAEQLYVSTNTIKTHLAHVFAKLGVASRAELATLATRRSAAEAGPSA